MTPEQFKEWFKQFIKSLDEHDKVYIVSPDYESAHDLYDSINYAMAKVHSLADSRLYGPRIAPELAAKQDRNIILVFEWMDAKRVHYMQTCTWSDYKKGVTTLTTFHPDTPPGAIGHHLRAVVDYHIDPPEDAFHDT